MFFFILQILPFCEFYHTTPFSAQIVAKGFATIVPGRSNGTGILLHGLPLRPPRLRLGVAVWDYYQASTTTLLPQTDQPDVGGAEVDFLPVSISLLIPRIKSGMAVTNLLTVGVLILMSANHAIAQADDHQAPKVIGCPDSINVNLAQGNSDVVVTWTEPSTSETIGVSMTKTHQPGSIFTDGVTTVLYTFTDQAGNSTICTFNVTVSTDDHQAPKVIGCPDSINVNLPQGNSDVVVTWTEPSTSETIGVSMTKTHQPGSIFTDGVTTVLYTFTDQAGNSTICTFNVTVSTTIGGAPTESFTRTFIICVIIFVIVLLFGCMYYYFLRYRKRKHQHSKPQEVPARDQQMTSYKNEVTPDDVVHTTALDSVPVVHQNHASAYEPVRDVHLSPTYEYVSLPTWAEPWNVLWDNFIVGTKVLRKGQFGEVLYGGVMIAGELCKAAIKKLQEHASPAERKIFLDEFLSMTKIGQHPNIVMLLGACQHEGELYVATEYLPNGDLRSYLRNARSMDSEASISSDLLQFALDVAKGMQHLAATGVIHRDLAARNILLDENLVAKISDYGLSRGEDTYVQTSKTRVPARWLSLESLVSKTYTTKSDVWSYGILLWEIATVGGTPYPGIQTGVLASKLKNGYRMPKPINCDVKIYDVMLKCWREKPNERPSFKNIVSVLTTMTENQDDQIYMSLLPRSEEHVVNINPEFGDN
ncbi:fibroblast growth factor receptor 2-like isoform X3 [Asterias rubens]|uniref:fibroblast growth factor receptor 2-like isoform X3 n=1 Tax=Asterias rubens TaxID=7604 RepID=UPI00145598F4|nr:fibroblast growth factor receptor 2-like isoform X3 [Asterias rubens]